MGVVAELPFQQAVPGGCVPRQRELQTQGAIHRVRTATGDEAWLVTSYELVRRLADDDRLGHSHPTPHTAARKGESIFFGPVYDFTTEPDQKARARSLLHSQFSPKRMRALRPRMEAMADQLLDRMAEQGPPVDLNAAVAVPLTMQVICELLGVPYADRRIFEVWTRDATNIVDRDRSQRGMTELFAYGQKLVARKRTDPHDDVVSRLCAVDGLSDAEITLLSMMLLIIGHDTTAVHIGLGAMLLLTHPDQWQSLVAGSGSMVKAVEEILRAPGHGDGGMSRYARIDFEVDGVTVRRGDLVLLDYAAANHDPTVFPDPDRVDITRSANPAHLSFGVGGHYCIGAPLARNQLRTLFTKLASRFPTLRLAVDVNDLTMNRNLLIPGPTTLPVKW